MIQKTEMEIIRMIMSNKVLGKTHKGEEVAEETDRELALEALSETAILSSDVGAAGESGSAALADGDGALEVWRSFRTDRHGTHHFDLKCRSTGRRKHSAVADR